MEIREINRKREPREDEKRITILKPNEWKLTPDLQWTVTTGQGSFKLYGTVKGRNGLLIVREIAKGKPTNNFFLARSPDVAVDTQYRDTDSPAQIMMPTREGFAILNQVKLEEEVN